MAVSDIITVETTIDAFLRQELPNNTRFQELSFDVGDITTYRGGQEVTVRCPALVVNSGDSWTVESNPRTMAGSKWDESTCIVIGLIERQPIASRELDVRRFGIAVMQTLNSVVGMADGVTGKEVVGFAQSLTIDHNMSAADMFVEQNRDKVFRGFRVVYNFRVYNNV